MLDAIQKVEERIQRACARSGRSRNEVTLVAVSKTFPAESIKKAYEAGLRIFGESRAQEFKSKVIGLPDDIEWHFIGHLQSNKIKYVLPHVHLLHSIDSLALAEAASRYAQKHGLSVSVLMEINTSGEKAKYGFSPQEAADAFLKMNDMQGIVLKGFMTIAPFVSDEKKIRASFQLLRRIKEEVSRFTAPENTAELSMGMSADFETAIEEGSTIVRVGTAIFGSREVQ